ncbi:hypothetical protein AVEN_31143-1 [Araneus ventricosus]|uniref:Uncharacterized protein n=1 Tax=Araneus ventricosus TaxID=182803 RepID=A0A4Y2IN00_ARAVE|nr:hypothetical protein AVEN_31143-1 [Araneus ventricosus]
MGVLPRSLSCGGQVIQYHRNGEVVCWLCRTGVPSEPQRPTAAKTAPCWHAGDRSFDPSDQSFGTRAGTYTRLWREGVGAGGSSIWILPVDYVLTFQE